MSTPIDLALQQANDLLDRFETTAQRTQSDASLLLGAAQLYNELFYGTDEGATDEGVTNLRNRIVRNQEVGIRAYRAEASNSVKAQAR